ncbi:MAG: hypothetical protein JST54_00050 [Deltaproteobacteria bacterium]|nr:hypothetical protein [Deltaproteobacteria bacterium]
MTPKPPTPSATPAVWMVGPGYDLAVYSGVALYGAGLVLGLGHFFDPRRLFVFFNVAFTLGHYGPTWLRAFGDTAELRARPLQILGFPLAAAAFVFGTAANPEVLACVLYLWDRWHAVMQSFGFARIYDAKLGRTEPHWAWLDRALLFACAFFFMSLNVALLTPLIERAASVGLDLSPSPAALHAIRWTLGLITAGIVGAYAVALARAHRRDGRWPAPKLAYLGLLVGGHALMNTTSNVFLLSCHEKVYHCVQYYSITWHYERKRRAATSRRWLDRALASRASVPAFGAMVLLWIAGAVAISRALSTGSSELYLAGFTRAFGGLALVHYYFDSFLWKVRRVEVRANL